jgi:hypothetical protein
MKTSTTRIAHLKKMILLEERRTQLQSQLAAVNEQLCALQKEFSSFAGIRSVATRRGTKALEGRGELRPAQTPVPVSFRNARVRRAALSSAAARRVAHEPATLGNGGGTAPKPPQPKNGAGKIHLKRGELKARILGALRQAGNNGITIKELSEKLDSKYKNVYIWFVTTGKRISGIKKIGLARYKLESVA